MSRTKVIILGAAGRDFHNFNCRYRGNKDFEVALAQTSTINSIEGYMWGDPEGGEVRLAVYYSDNANNIPTGTPIFKQTFKTSEADDWYGISGINLSLDPGTYWAAFEVAPSQVPIPGAFLLFGSGLLGLFGSKIRRKKE